MQKLPWRVVDGQREVRRNYSRFEDKSGTHRRRPGDIGCKARIYDMESDTLSSVVRGEMTIVARNLAVP